MFAPPKCKLQSWLSTKLPCVFVCVLLLITDVVTVDFQETKRYTFPVVLSMREFCESCKEIADDQEYELFSVVIHG